MLWYYAVNTFTPGSSVALGTVISSHRTANAAAQACRDAQPRERNSYLPTSVMCGERRLNRGVILDHGDASDATEYR